jgi:site-specific DNA recombinase
MKAIEFRRVSTDEQAADDKAGLARQKEANARTIKRYNLEIVDTIEIIGVSGTEIIDDPRFKKMMAGIKSDGIRALVVADQDRLLRLFNLRHLSILQDLIDSDVLIYLSDRIVDLNEQNDWLLSIIQAAIGGNELKQMRKRIEGAKESKRKAGKHPSNRLTLPLGVSYDREKQEYFYNDEIQKVSKLFDLFHNKGVQNFKELEKKTEIKHRTIANLLRNELYIGFRAYTEKRSKEGKVGKRKKIKRVTDEIIRVKVIDKPIIKESVFQQVQKILETKNKEYHKKRPSDGRRFLYSGFLRCGACGEIMYSASGGRDHKRDYYCCKRKKISTLKCSSSYLQKELVEENITSFVTDKLTDTNYIKKMINQKFSNKHLQEAKGEIEGLKKELATISKRQDKLIDAYEVSHINKAQLALRLEKLSVEEKSLNSKIEKIEVPNRFKDQINIKHTIESIATTSSEFRFWTSSQKREFLRSQMLEFSITEDGVIDCMLRVSNLGNPMGRGSWPRRA